MKPLILILISIFPSCGPAWDVQKETYNDTISQGTPSQGITSQNINLLKIIIFDVGNGDAALIIAPNNDAVLIDTGPPASGNTIINPYLSTNRNIDLKYLFISHSDSDHAGAANEIDKEPENFEAGDRFYLGDEVEIAALAKDCKFSNGAQVNCDLTDDNAHSAAMLITYGDFKYLTEGDLPGGGGNPPYQTIDLESTLAPLVGDIDILHIAHHGSNTSTNQNLLNLTIPEVAIISVGNNNDYWHPHQSIIERLLASDIAVYQTERGWLRDEFLNSVHVMNGTIVIETDGEGYTISP